MTLDQVLVALREGARARRAGWHDGLLYIHAPSRTDFLEVILVYRQGGHDREQPWPPRRADWFADDWSLL